MIGSKSKKIKLNTGRYVLVDAEMYIFLSAFSWWEHHSGYATAKMDNKNVVMHRFILMLTDSSLVVDHINRNRRDNRVSNLRLCDRKTNTYNCKLPHTNSTGYKGVSYHKKNGTYVAYIGKTPRVYLGSFATPEEAANAYNIAAIDRFGEFASINKTPQEQKTKESSGSGLFNQQNNILS